MTQHKTDMNITEIDKYKKSEQHFYDRTPNRIQLHFGEPNDKHIQIQQKEQQTSRLPTKKVNENIQSATNKYTFLYL